MGALSARRFARFVVELSKVSRALLATVTAEVFVIAPAPLSRSSPAVTFVVPVYVAGPASTIRPAPPVTRRSEEHTSELQSHSDLVCRLLLEKKKHTPPDSILLPLSG